MHLDSKEDNTVQRLAKVLKNASEKDTADTFGLDETDSPNNGTAEETESEGNHNRENKLDVSVDEVDGVYIQDPGEVPNENSCSNSGDFDCVDGVQETVEDNRLKHEELLMRDLKVCCFQTFHAVFPLPRLTFLKINKLSLCRVAALKSLPVHRCGGVIFTFSGLCRL